MAQSVTNEYGFSVIIATYNGAPIIEKTLTSLKEIHTVPGLPMEILLVDNNSTDDTIERALSTWQGDCELRVMKELRQGTGYAKYHGMKEARYSYLGIVDQDNWVDDNWLEKSVQYLDEARDVAIVFGRGIPVFEALKPEWFDRYENNFAVGRQLSHNGVAVSNHFFYAAGSVMRKAAFDELNSFGFTPLLQSRARETLLSGEDTELQILLYLLGWNLHYQDDLNFYHIMPTKRLTRDYFIKLRKGLGATSVYLNLYRNYMDEHFQRSQRLDMGWEALLFDSFKRLINDPAAIIGSFFSRHTSNYRVAKFWSNLGEFEERLRVFSVLKTIKENLYSWLDSMPKVYRS